ncbi:MAG: DNA/RNA non-specific endonuclease [Bacteroidales bacterium]|nr:DNA/RNA non-specific endonuclease [Bacteroidales bacterium]
MRKLSLFLLPAVMGLIAAGCTQIEQLDPERPVEEEFLIHKTFYAETEGTRTTLDGVDVYFSEGEAISIWDGTGNRKYTADESGRNVSFSGEVAETATEFYALAPYSESTVFARNGNMVTAATTLASAQEATVGTFADGANISAAQSTSDDSFALKNVLAVAKLTLASANLNGHQIASVELTSTHPLAGDVTVTYGDIPTAEAGANTVKTVSLSHSDGTALADGTYYLTLLPNDGGQITLKFTATDGYTATKTATLKSAFEAGTIKNLGTVKGLEWEEPKYYFMPVSEVTDGTYLIVANKEGDLLAAKAVIPSSGNTYGYPGTVSVTQKVDNNGYIVMDDLAEAFVFTTTNNGMTIRQLYDNKYWYQSGSYTSISIDGSVSANSYYNISPNNDGTFKILSISTNRYLQYSTSYKTFGSYPNATGIVPTLYRLVDPEEVTATVTLITLDASGITGASAVLNANYSGLFPINAVNVGFKYGKSRSALNEEAYSDNAFTTASGSYSVEIASLSENTTYYYQAIMQVWDPVTNSYKEFLGEIKSFTTGENAPVTDWKGWLELPANTLTADNYIYDEQMVGSDRNYTMSYDVSTYAAMWVAYPLYSATMGSTSRPNNWKYNDHFSSDYQVDVRKSSYGVSWTESYGNELYSRGHQIPNADRNVDSDWQIQTFLVTNSTPQIQNRFNGSIWGSLEDAVRDVANNTDTLYVITGPVFQKVGETKTIKYITPQDDPGKSVPVPNYYWKALLKVKWSGKTVTDAKAIGFWYEHKAYEKKESFSKDEYVVSIAQIEAWTGLDLFVNLPGDNESGLENQAQSNTSWTTFQNY